MIRLLRLAALGFLVFSFNLTVAQDRKLDRALDRYEVICERCIDLRQQAVAGEPVPQGAITDLLSELSLLRSTLQEAGSAMTPSQAARFERIRLRYAAAFSPVRTPLLEGPFPSVIRGRIPVHACSLPERIMPYRSAAPLRTVPEVHTGLFLYGGIPDGSAGLMLRVRADKVGGFVKGSLTPSRLRESYSCFSDGRTADGGYIWTSGKEAHSRSSMAAGILYAPLSWLECYAGAGYGRRIVFWEDVSGDWASVSDLSPQGICTDAGIILTWRHMSVLAGVSAIRFRSPVLEIGLGVTF